ncbi:MULTISPECIES: hypothetical protein [Streptomyces]|uniref:Uncharacterized protein n=1 Tax=Streptomyces edwardsiae TaxID=3075527 RepID=A0ABU2QHB0_9ACTN|nr:MULTISPECIES: hypothetical protein [unclassified Streptomyces]MDT0403249.1 hypothetical protein [Streptomyces sp. DSM 41635]
MGTFRRRLLLAVDAKGYGRVDVVTQRQLQGAIQELLAVSADASGLERERWETQVGGDSVLAVLPEGASEPHLVDPFMRHLDAGLREFNHVRVREAWLRLRVAVHFGTAARAANGFEGRAPVEIGRMLDSAPLRAALDAAPDACMALAVSSTVFNDVIREAYTTIRAREFHEVAIEEKEYAGRIWIRVPGHDGPVSRPGTAEPAQGRAKGGEPPDVRPSNASTPSGDTVVQVISGTVHAPGAVFGISK